MLLERGAELDTQTFSGGTPLMRAIESSREGVVEFLISKGCVVLYNSISGEGGSSSIDSAVMCRLY